MSENTLKRGPYAALVMQHMKRLLTASEHRFQLSQMSQGRWHPRRDRTRISARGKQWTFAVRTPVESIGMNGVRMAGLVGRLL